MYLGPSGTPFIVGHTLLAAQQSLLKGSLIARLKTAKKLLLLSESNSNTPQTGGLRLVSPIMLIWPFVVEVSDYLSFSW